MTAVLFPLGSILATPGALSLLADADVNPVEFLKRHRCGDWARCYRRTRKNDLSVRTGLRVLSSYRVEVSGERIWIITEADRSSTCLLLPQEY